jgi:tetratricopeptide (TPR) repeat protein
MSSWLVPESQGRDKLTMRRGVFAEWAVLLWLLAAQAGCSWVGLRQWSNRPTPTPEEAAQAQQIIEHAQAAIDHGDVASAELALENQVARTPASAVAQQRLGAVYLLEGRLGDAKNCFSRALKLDPDYVDAVIGLGQVETQEGDPVSARKRFETAIEIDPHRTQAHFALGGVLQIMGQTDSALAEYFRALECEPNLAEASRCIAAIQLNRNQPEQALSRLDRVLEMTAADGEARFLRGRAQLALGHSEAAIADFQNAIRGLPGRADIYYHLALAFEVHHKPAEALRAAREAMRLAPGFEQAQSLSNRLSLAMAPIGTPRPKPATGAETRAERDGPVDPPRPR